MLVVEDGPTVTHGGMPFGAGVVTAEKYGAGELVDPRPFAVESIAATYAKYPHMVKILPAMGYGEKQVADLAATIDKVDCDLIISATPIDLNRLIKTRKPMLPVGYDLQEIGSPTIEDVLQKF